jgi:alpha-amylase
MKLTKKALLLLIAASFAFYGCQKEEIIDQPDQNVQESENGLSALPPGGGVMMQAFYWDVPAGGTWWNTVEGKVDDWANAGMTAIWLPPVSKAQNGPFSMGYDPFDYFDFGEYNQMGSTETRFGSRTELEDLIAESHNNGLDVYADIVLNHNSGGAREYNPFTGDSTWTDFNPASGKFFRSSTDFHPNNVVQNDEGIFGGFPDLSHSQTYVQDWLWNRSDGVGKYYKNTMGFDGWRFDYVKGFGPWVVSNWNSNVGGFSVGELWDSNVNLLEGWANSANSSVFDFACYYKMDEAFDGGNLSKLYDDMMWKRNPFKAVTFVANHDTDIIWEKMLAYSYILTHEGYPCIFYRDYEEWLNKERLDNLIWIHNNKAVGSTTILYADNDEYVARRNGNPGLVVYINNSNSWQERWVETNWSSTQIKDYTGHSNWYPWTQSGKWVKIQVPPKSYSIWSPV